MKHEKRHVGSRILSILLAMVLTVSGMIVPVQASALPSAEENPAYEQQVSETGEPLTETGEDALQNTGKCSNRGRVTGVFTGESESGRRSSICTYGRIYRSGRRETVCLLPV